MATPFPPFPPHPPDSIAPSLILIDGKRNGMRNANLKSGISFGESGKRKALAGLPARLKRFAVQSFSHSLSHSIIH